MKRDTEKERAKHPIRPAGEEPRVPDSPRSDAFSLQRQAGNQAVLNLLHSGVAQPKLHLSQPNDPDELDASQLASLVDSDETKSLNPHASSEEPRESPARDNITTPHSPSALTGMPSELSPSLNSGQPLDSALRKTMESKFGADFCNVRIHTGEEAKSASEALDARAFTVGSHVVFNAGQYAPASRSGRKLIAHELAHVSQNQESAAPGNPAGGATIKRESIIGKASAYLSEKKEQAGKAIDARKWEIYRAMIAGMKSGKNFTVSKLRSMIPRLPQSVQSAASGIVDSFDFSVDIIIALLLAIVGLAVGFVD